MSQTLIITGMHRSGTSFIASILQAMGINVGDNILEANQFNSPGYFEDVDFLEFQRAVLQACCFTDEPGHPDWGWTISERLESTKFKDYIEGAKKLIKSRDQKAAIWGWKDPRTSLILDFWDELIPNAKYFFVYRFPWDVWYSTMRTNNPVLDVQLYAPLKIWCFYNRHILNFYQRHPSRCILVNINAFLENTRISHLAYLIKNKLDLQLPYSTDTSKILKLYDSTIFKTLDWHHPLVERTRIYNQTITYLRELDQLADIPSNYFKPQEQLKFFFNWRRIKQVVLKHNSLIIIPTNSHKNYAICHKSSTPNISDSEDKIAKLVNLKPNVKVVKVSRYNLSRKSLLAHSIDIPKNQIKLHTSYIQISGWVLGNSAPALKVELKNNNYILWEIPVNRSRPDVAAVYPDAPEAKTSGFSAEVEIIGMPAKLEIILEAAFPDGIHVPLGAIALCRL